MQTGLVINEVCSKNEGILADDTGLYGDYIELYNPTRFRVSLSSFYVTDDLEKNPVQVSGDEVIPAGGYAVVWTGTGDNGFQISAAGNETIYLLNGNGAVVDSVTVPALEENTVYARDPSGTGWEVSDPTPLAENSTVRIREVAPPVFSAESGFYQEAFTLELSAADGCTIYYTLDSSIPDQSSLLYTGGIAVKNVCEEPNVYRAEAKVVEDWNYFTPPEEPVDKVMIIRAVAIDEYGNRSDVVTKSYFVDMEQYEERYVLSLVSDPEELFGEEGILVTGTAYDAWYLGGQEGEKPTPNFSKHGMNYETEASVELFYTDLLMSQSAGLRVHGASSRGNAQKRLKLYARNRYSGSRYFSCDLFGYQMHSFLLKDELSDVVAQSMVPDRSIGGMQSVRVSVFLDGEFWYDTFLRERYDEDYLAQKFNVNPEEVILEREAVPEEIYTCLENLDLSREEDYEIFGQLLDIQNYIDYLTCNIYLSNMDLSETKNAVVWRTEGTSGQGYDDGRWRFLLYDMDSILWNDSDYYGTKSWGINSFSAEREFIGNAYDEEIIFTALKTNETFCRQFVLTFMDFANTYFEKTMVEEKLAQWDWDISWMDSFFERRFDCIVPCLAEEFDLSGTLEQITLEISQTDAGSIQINTVTPDLSQGEWSGFYYTDYPVTISAEPAEGWEFVSWHHGEEIFTEKEITVELNGEDNLWAAEFIKSGEE